MWSRWTLTWQWRGQPGPRLAVFLICCGAATTAAQSIAAPRDARPSNQTTGTGTERGRVVAVGSDVAAPIRDARVSISTPAGSIDPVFTDASGRFEVDGLLAGRYTLTAEKTGYVKTLDGSKGDLDPPIPVDVGDAMPVDGIEIRMPKGAAILGRLVDELGDPVVGAAISVGVVRAAGADTRLVTIARPGLETNDRGEYRVGDLYLGIWRRPRLTSMPLCG